MDAHESWQCQGRQYHGWFGDGTCAESGLSDDRRASAAEMAKARHVLAVLYGAVGALPQTLRARWEGWLHRGGADSLSTLLGAWSADRFDRAAFRAQFLPDMMGERVGAAAHELAAATSSADDTAGDAAASAKLAELVQAVGLDGWSRFVAAAEEKAAAVSASPGPAGVIPVQEPLIETVPRLFAKPPEEVVPRYMERIPRQSGKEAASDIPSWARGKPRRVGETPREFAKRLMDEHYGKSRWREENPDFGKLKKWGARAWRNPRSAPAIIEGEKPQA